MTDRVGECCGLGQPAIQWLWIQAVRVKACDWPPKAGTPNPRRHFGKEPSVDLPVSRSAAR